MIVYSANKLLEQKVHLLRREADEMAQVSQVPIHFQSYDDLW